MFKGSYPALVTPFKNGAVDFDALKKLVDWHVAEGSHGLVPVGTTGESPTLSHAEHGQVIEAVVKAAGTGSVRGVPTTGVLGKAEKLKKELGGLVGSAEPPKAGKGEVLEMMVDAHFDSLHRMFRGTPEPFSETLKVFSHLANVGDCRSLVIHPASTTHFRMDDAALRAAGIGPGTIRLSIGLEDADDLIDDLKRALRAAEKAA